MDEIKQQNDISEECNNNQLISGLYYVATTFDCNLGINESLFIDAANKIKEQAKEIERLKKTLNETLNKMRCSSMYAIEYVDKVRERNGY